MKLSYLMTTAIPWHLATPPLVYASRPNIRSLLQITDCPSTCSPALCDCVSFHSPSSCASQVHSVCSSGTLNLCVPTGAVGQFRSLHCSFAACLVDGRSEEECECELIGKTCETFEESDMGLCEMAKCCKEQVDDVGKSKCLSGELVNDERTELSQSEIEFDDSVTIGSTVDKLTQSSFKMGGLPFVPLIDDLIPVTDDLLPLGVDAMDTLANPTVTPTAAPATVALLGAKSSKSFSPNHSYSPSYAKSAKSNQPTAGKSSKRSKSYSPTSINGKNSKASNIPTASSILPLTDYCPEAYDEYSATSYTTGTRVEVDRYIYECSYDYYCKFPDYQPVKGESWSDVWSVISPCSSSIAEDGTAAGIMFAPGKASKESNATSTKASKSEGPTILSSKGSKSYSLSLSSKSAKMTKTQSPIISGKSSKALNGTAVMLSSTLLVSGKASKDSNSTSAKSAKSDGPTILSSKGSKSYSLSLSSKSSKSQSPIVSGKSSKSVNGTTAMLSSTLLTSGKASKDSNSTSAKSTKSDGPTILSSKGSKSYSLSLSSKSSKSQSPIVSGKSSKSSSGPTSTICPLTKDCPETYDEFWASSYTTGTRVEVDGYIYECNSYPYGIYCKFPEYQPLHGSESWSDVWSVISPCSSSIAADGSAAFALLTSGKASKDSNSTSAKSAKSEGPTILSSKGSKSYSLSLSTKSSKSQSPNVSGKSSKALNGTAVMLSSTLLASGKSSKDSNSTSSKSAKSEGPTILSSKGSKSYSLSLSSKSSKSQSPNVSGKSSKSVNGTTAMLISTLGKSSKGSNSTYLAKSGKSESPSSTSSAKSGKSQSPVVGGKSSKSSNVPLTALYQTTVPTPTIIYPFADSYSKIYCPETYDEFRASSYTAGSQVEVEGYIYECNSFPYDIYCTFLEYQPVFGNEFWTDAWSRVSRCSSPTASPTTKEPTSTQREEVSMIQFIMQPMARTINDYEKSTVFEPACRDYLTRQLFVERPQVFNIECKVTNQQLLSNRRILISWLNTISVGQPKEQENSLLVNLEVTGVTVNATSNETDFGDTVHDAFEQDSEIFIRSIKTESEIAGMDIFEELESLSSVTQLNFQDVILEEGSQEIKSDSDFPLELVIGLVALALVLFGFVYLMRSHFRDDDSVGLNKVKKHDMRMSGKWNDDDRSYNTAAVDDDSVGLNKVKKHDMRMSGKWNDDDRSYNTAAVVGRKGCCHCNLDNALCTCHFDCSR